ncbi:MAG TPA: hypothetical protein VH702_18790 [Vicinamibacterales bacterium]
MEMRWWQVFWNWFDSTIPSTSLSSGVFSRVSVNYSADLKTRIQLMEVSIALGSRRRTSLTGASRLIRSKNPFATAVERLHT